MKVFILGWVEEMNTNICFGCENICLDVNFFAYSDVLTVYKNKQSN